MTESNTQPPAPEEQQKIKNEASWVELLKSEIGRVIVGQKYLVDRLIVGLLANGHVLLEGVPGLAKTLAVKTLSQCLRADFKRIQFTPDLLPADVLGTLIYSPSKGEFTTKKGPIFTNLLLADEIIEHLLKFKVLYLKECRRDRLPLEMKLIPSPNPF
jgi:MoxR-like ATPase